MVELKTIGGALPEIPVEDIASEDILKVQVGTMSSLPSQLWAILSAYFVYIYIYISIGVKRNNGSKWYWVKNLFAFTSRVPLNVLYLYDSDEGGNSGQQDDSEKVLSATEL